MSNNLAFYLIMFLIIGAGWFFFFGQSIKHDAKSKSVLNIRNWTLFCTFFPWFSLVYVIARYYIPKSDKKCENPSEEKIKSFISLLIAIGCLVAFVFVLNAMVKNGVVTVE